MRPTLFALLAFLVTSPIAGVVGQSTKLQQLEAEVNQLNQLPVPDEQKLGTLHLTLAQLYNRAGQVGQARLNADLAKASFSETSPEYLPVIENLRGNLALAAGDQFEALAAFNEGLNSFYWGTHRGLPRPHPDSIHGRQFAEATMLLGNRAALLANSNRPLEAFLDYELLFLLNDRSRTSLSPEEREKYPSADIRQYYDVAVDMLVGQSVASGDASLLWDAFDLSERAKEYSRLRALRPSPAQTSQRIQLLEERIAELKAINSPGAEAAQLQLDRLLYGREKPAFSRVAEPPGRSVLEPLKAQNKSLISFHAGRASGHAFMINGNLGSIAHQVIPSRDSLRGLVTSLLRSINAYSVAEPAARTDAFASTSREVYRRLFGKLKLPEGGLLILLDRPLGDLPFACLLAEETSLGQAAADLPYLIKEHDLQLAHSSQVLLPGPGEAAEFSTYFAGYSANEQLLPSPAPANGPQPVLIDRESFLARVGEARIAHLFASLNPADAPPVLNFGDQDGKVGVESTLTQSEIASLDLRNDLLIVQGNSADFSEALRVAGAQSCLSFHWPFAQAAEDAFFKQFYGRLSEGAPSDQALSSTQRSMLASNDLADPIFWAAPRMVGRALPLVPGEGIKKPFRFEWIEIAGGLALLAGVLFLIQKVMGKKARSNT